MTSPQASRRGSFVAPALLFVALLGGALFFGVLAMSGTNQTPITTDNAAVTDPSPSKTAPAAKTIATTRPSVTATPPATGRTGSPSANGHTRSPSAAVRSGSASADARAIVPPARKAAPGRTETQVEGDYCAQAGAEASSVTGDHLVCTATEANDHGRWVDQG
ncbi:hypothetical protein [Actinoplanes subtropicus]|uniref:hypothetical protein n=1 Tax=Actinoplanes subtropicus TaxID=543632 RepID=UPI000A5A54B6|nr:hypothetical protein [Actinoplanes subtropicus]